MQDVVHDRWSRARLSTVENNDAEIGRIQVMRIGVERTTSLYRSVARNRRISSSRNGAERLSVLRFKRNSETQ